MCDWECLCSYLGTKCTSRENSRYFISTNFLNCDSSFYNDKFQCIPNNYRTLEAVIVRINVYALLLFPACRSPPSQMVLWGHISLFVILSPHQSGLSSGHASEIRFSSVIS